MIDQRRNLLSEKWIQLIPLGIVLAGSLIRMYHFLINRSLWLDETYLVSGLINLNLAQLAVQPLDYQQQAPLGFLYAVKLCIIFFGENEMALRLFPLVCGLASLFIFLRVSQYFLNYNGVVVAVAILAFAPYLIFHSVEIKQYSTELLATVLALWLYIKYHGKPDFSSLFMWGISGAVLVWFSYSVVFILAGIAGGYCVHLIFSKNWRLLWFSLIPFAFWMLSFLSNYFIYLYQPDKYEWLKLWLESQGGFLPLPPGVEMLKWIGFRFYRILEYPLGLLWKWHDLTSEQFLVRNLLLMPLLPFLFFAIGIYTLARTRIQWLMVLLFPVLIIFLASGMKLYPIFERFTVFFSPLLILIMGKGAEEFTDYKLIRSFAILFIALFLTGPVVTSTRELIYPSEMGGYKNTKYRETLKHIDTNFKEGDLVYVYWNFVPQYQVYKKLEPLRYDAILGKDVREISSNEIEYFEKLSPDFEKLRGHRRVWLVFEENLAFDIGDISEDTWYHRGDFGSKPGLRILNKVRSLGKEIEHYETQHSSVYLFDLSGR